MSEEEHFIPQLIGLAPLQSGRSAGTKKFIPKKKQPSNQPEFGLNISIPKSVETDALRDAHAPVHFQSSSSTIQSDESVSRSDNIDAGKVGPETTSQVDSICVNRKDVPSIVNMQASIEVRVNDETSISSTSLSQVNVVSSDIPEAINLRADVSEPIYSNDTEVSVNQSGCPGRTRTLQKRGRKSKVQDSSLSIVEDETTATETSAETAPVPRSAQTKQRYTQDEEQVARQAAAAVLQDLKIRNRVGRAVKKSSISATRGKRSKRRGIPESNSVTSSHSGQAFNDIDFEIPRKRKMSDTADKALTPANAASSDSDTGSGNNQRRSGGSRKQNQYLSDGEKNISTSPDPINEMSQTFTEEKGIRSVEAAARLKLKLLRKKNASEWVRQLANRWTDVDVGRKRVMGLMTFSNTDKCVEEGSGLEENSSSFEIVSMKEMKKSDVDNQRLMKRNIVAMKKIQAGMMLPYSFGQGLGYTLHTLYLKKSSRGVGLRVRIIDDRVVVRGFADWFNPSINIRVNDVIAAANATDARTGKPGRIINEFNYKPPPDPTEKVMVGLSMVEETICLSIARPNIYATHLEIVREVPSDVGMLASQVLAVGATTSIAAIDQAQEGTPLHPPPLLPSSPSTHIPKRTPIIPRQRTPIIPGVSSASTSATPKIKIRVVAGSHDRNGASK